MTIIRWRTVLVSADKGMALQFDRPTGPPFRDGPKGLVVGNVVVDVGDSGPGWRVVSMPYEKKA